MSEAFGESTQESADLLNLAHGLVQQCPPELGEEIVVVGSAGLGCADTHSDLDIEFWGKTLPSWESVTTWLESVGAVDLTLDRESGDDELNISCRYEKVWIEAGWRDINHKEKLIQTILAGQDTTRLNLLQIGNIFYAVPLRTTGILKRWQQKLSTYPDVVQKQVILGASAFWTFPHRVEMLWTLAQREEPLGLTIWLTADVSDALRILFAVNQQWEMDWKHLRTVSQRLAVKPDKLADRVDKVFTVQQLAHRVKIAMQLILDVLELVPSSYDVTRAKTNFQRSLEEHA